VTPLASFIAVIVNPLFPVYVRDIAAVPLERVGIFVGLVALGAAASSAVNGRIADRFGPVRRSSARRGADLGAATIASPARRAAACARLAAHRLADRGESRARVRARARSAARTVQPRYTGFQLVYALGFGGGGLLSGVLYDADPLLPFSSRSRSRCR